MIFFIEMMPVGRVYRAMKMYMFVAAVADISNRTASCHISYGEHSNIYVTYVLVHKHFFFCSVYLDGVFLIYVSYFVGK